MDLTTQAIERLIERKLDLPSKEVLRPTVADLMRELLPQILAQHGDEIARLLLPLIDQALFERLTREAETPPSR